MLINSSSNLEYMTNNFGLMNSDGFILICTLEGRQSDFYKYCAFLITVFVMCFNQTCLNINTCVVYSPAGIAHDHNGPRWL